jgi:pimeloyl-ACP methyl ester carboxylesterase
MSRLHVGEVEVAFERLGQVGPVVVFESGLGEDLRRWEQVARSLAACARVVLYDRPGIGRSGPRTGGASVLLAGTVVEQLAALLQAIEAPPPYILVGHSLGGFYMQAFARNRPHEVAAVVLIDSANPFEPPGVFGSTDPPMPGSVTVIEEAGFAPSVAGMLAGPPFPPVPLIVLAATDHGATPEREALWRDVQIRTAALSPSGQLRVVHGSGHFIQNDRPEAVIQAILQVMRETEHGTRTRAGKAILP